MMKKRETFFLFLLVLLFASCRMSTKESMTQQEKEGIAVVRYDKLLNEYVRSNSFSALQKMNMEYRQPTKILIEEVLAIGQVADDTISQKLKLFYSDTTLLRLMDDVEKKFPNLDNVEKELTKGFRQLKKEVPSLKAPTFYAQISAFNESVILSDSLLGISLDKYMGEDYPLYKRYFYEYQRHSMRPERIVPDCFTFYLESQYLYPYQEGVSLSNVMLHHGKINYAVQKALGYHSPDEVLGYSEQERNWCIENEKNVWAYLLKNQHLQARDPMVLRKYMKPAPFTAFFGDNAPALIGIWVGARIVAAYMDRHKNMTLQELLEMTDYRQLLDESGYPGN